MGNGQSDRVARTGAAPDRRPQAGRIAEAIGANARDGGASGLSDREAYDRAEEGIVLPTLLFLPEKPKANRVVLYVHEQGKAADAGPGGPIEQRVQAGDAVLAVDLRGTGQTRSTSAAIFARIPGCVHRVSARSFYVGIRAEDDSSVRPLCGRASGEQPSSARRRWQRWHSRPARGSPRTAPISAHSAVTDASIVVERHSQPHRQRLVCEYSPRRPAPLRSAKPHLASRNDSCC